MLGPIQFHVLRHIRHDNPHAAQSLLNDFAGALIRIPIPYANGLDTLAASVVGRLREKLERDACVCIRQGEDQALVEKRV